MPSRVHIPWRSVSCRLGSLTVEPPPPDGLSRTLLKWWAREIAAGGTPNPQMRTTESSAGLAGPFPDDSQTWMRWLSKLFALEFSIETAEIVSRAPSLSEPQDPGLVHPRWQTSRCHREEI